VRDVIQYCVGSEHSPTDPFGLSDLVIQVDGSARLDQFRHGAHTAWIGNVAASVIEELWAAMKEADFPNFPVHYPPAGSAIRDLNVGGRDGKSAYIAYHAAEGIVGYRTVFQILDQIIRQISEDTVQVVANSGVRIVDSIARVAPNA
jgi:hypothetical protein